MKKNLLKIIIPTLVIIVAVSIAGAFAIGYNKGRDDFVRNTTIVSKIDQFTVEGVYKRSYYNNYSKSVDSYIVLRADNTCRYISSIASEYSTTLDFKRPHYDYEICNYTYDETTESGVINSGSISTLVDHGVEHKTETVTPMSFTYTGATITVGGALYSKIQAEY